MAGLGYKSFSAGDVLTAAQVQGYLQDQAVMRFADSTARASAIGTANFTEGMISYLDNTNQVEYYSGSTWASIAPVSTQGLTLLNTTSFSAVASQSVNDCFSSAYTSYLVIATITATNAATADIFMRLRVAGTDASANNYSVYFTGINSGNTANNFVANAVSNWTLTAQHSSLTTGYQVARVELYGPNETNATEFTAQSLGLTSGGQFFSFAGAGLHDVATAYTGLTLLKSTGTMTGQIQVFGFNK